MDLRIEKCIRLTGKYATMLRWSTNHKESDTLVDELETTSIANMQKWARLWRRGEDFPNLDLAQQARD